MFHAQLAGKQWTQARVENVSFYDLDLDFTAPRKAFGRGPAHVGTETLYLLCRSCWTATLDRTDEGYVREPVVGT